MPSSQPVSNPPPPDGLEMGPSISVSEFPQSEGSGSLKTADEGGSATAVSVLQQDSVKLQHAFEQFSLLSREILSSYEHFEEHVDALNDELALVSRERIHEYEARMALVARLEGLLKILPSAVIAIDVNGLITDANRRAEALLSGARVGQSWREVVKAHFISGATCGVEATTCQGRKLHVATCPLDLGAGQLIVLTDVTDMRRLQLQVDRNRRLVAVGKAVASLSHQLKTPLSVALIYSGHLTNSTLDESQRQAMALKLQSRLEQMNEQINDMLLFSRGGLDNAALIDIPAWLPRHIPQWQELAAVRNIDLTITHQAGEDCVVEINEKAFTEAIANLLCNAIDAVAEVAAPRVSICSCSEDDWLWLTVIDNGPGIPAELSEEIFDPFVSGKSQGTGLGLAVVHTVIHSARGRVYWERLGDKTHFCVGLPLVHELHDSVKQGPTKGTIPVSDVTAEESNR